jgi:hypothetical protein
MTVKGSNTVAAILRVPEPLTNFSHVRFLYRLKFISVRPIHQNCFGVEGPK